MIKINQDVLTMIKRLAEQPHAVAVIDTVLLPIAKELESQLSDMDADAMPHQISRMQGFIRGVKHIKKAFDNAR